MTPECNGIAERANRTIIKTSRTMLADSKLNLEFWGKATNTVVYIRNRVKSRVHEKTPYEIWYEKQPKANETIWLHSLFTKERRQ